MLATCLFALCALSAPDDFDGLHSSVAAVGDQDGDGLEDLIWVDRAFDRRTRVYLLAGSDGSVLRAWEPWAGRNARIVVRAGDLDGDQVEEFLFVDSWRVQAWNGTRAEPLWTATPEREARPYAARLVAGSDWNGDDVPDVALSYSNESSDWREPFSSNWTIEVLSGRDGSRLDRIVCEPAAVLREPDPHRIVVSGVALSPMVRFVADRDGDGRSELAIVRELALQAEPVEGDTTAEPEAMRELVLVSSRRHEVLPSPRWSMGGAPWALAEVGDSTDDGVSELLYSYCAWSTRLVDGARDEELASWSYEGGYLHAEGSTLGPCGDLDADGVPDFFIAANETMDVDPGFCILYSGATRSVLRKHTPRGEQHGLDATSVADLDGDGVRDLAVSEVGVGEVRVYSGATDRVIWSRSASELAHAGEPKPRSDEPPDEPR